MKKKILFIIFALNCILSFAQKKVNEYSMEYFKNKPVYDIEASDPKNGKFTYFIYCYSLDSEPEVGFTIDSKDLEKFIESFRFIGEKLEENNVTDYDKGFEAKFKTIRVFFKFGSKYHMGYTKFIPFFKVTPEGDCLAVISTGELTASDNRFMHHDGLAMAFSNKDEIENFIKALDPNLVLTNESKNEATDILFK